MRLSIRDDFGCFQVIFLSGYMVVTTNLGIELLGFVAASQRQFLRVFLRGGGSLIDCGAFRTAAARALHSCFIAAP